MGQITYVKCYFKSFQEKKPQIFFLRDVISCVVDKMFIEGHFFRLGTPCPEKNSRLRACNSLTTSAIHVGEVTVFNTSL